MRQNLFLQYIAPAAMLCAILSPCGAQEKPAGCVQWKTYTDTVWVEQDVTENREISETAYETKQVTKSRPRWVSEERERTITEKKPVQQTGERLVTRTVQRPVTTTKTRSRTRVIESHEDVTEMRDEKYTVQKPVTETRYETKQVLVRKPVTERGVEKEEVTLYRPETSTQTTAVAGTLLVPGQNSNRSRIRWLQRGYYSDPYSGAPVWRRSGLHWVDEPTTSQNAIPVVVPQQQSSVTMVPETVVRDKPFERTTLVDEYESREVPVTVKRMVSETRTRKVPYTVRVPKREVIEEDVPYTETTYVTEKITERVPYTETVMKEVTRTEPYTQITESWVKYTETVKVPKTTTKTIPYTAKYRVPYLVEVRVPMDADGKPVARGQQVPKTHRLHPAWRKMITKVEGSKETIRETAATSVYEGSKGSAKSPAKFDVPETAKSILAEDAKSSESDSIGDPPKVRFNNAAKKEASTRMKTIVRAKPAPEKPTVPAETESSRRVREETEKRLLAKGFVPVDQPATEASQIETAIREPSSVTEEPAQAPFNPEPLTLEIEVPPEATPPANNSTQPDADGADDDTIEQNVDLSHPVRS